MEGFFSGSEIGIISFNKLTLKHKSLRGVGWAKKVSHLLENPQKLFGTTLLGTNLCTITSSTIITIFIMLTYGKEYEYFSFIIVPPLILIFAEIIPKIIYQRKKEYLLPRLIYPLTFFTNFLFAPVIYIISKLSKYILQALGVEQEIKEKFITKDDLKLILETDHLGEDVKKSEKIMIDKIFDFGDKDAKDDMIPLIDVVACDINSTIDNLINIINKHGFSRIPIYSERIDNIIGVLYSFDLLFAKENEKSIKKYVRSITYIPETHLLDELLIKMQKEALTIAIVVDEYGGATGIITIEDILEEIVGEIEDEHDNPEIMYKKISRNHIIIKARMEIDEINDLFGFDLPKDDYETLGGFIIDHLKRIPRQGEYFKYKNLNFVIKEANERAVEEVTVIVEQ